MRKHIQLLFCYIVLPIVLADETAVDRDWTEYRHPATVSKASVFSTIFALWLCSLTQPYGSLLLPGSSAWLRRVSPFSPTIDGMIIVYCLLMTPRRKSSHGTAHGGSSTATYVHPPQIAQPKTVVCHANFGAVRHVDSRRRDVDTGVHVKALPMPAINPSRPVSRLSRHLHRYSTTARTLLLIRSGKYINCSDIPSDDIESEFASRKIRRIEVLGIIPVVFICIKLCAISGAPLFVACGFIYIFSWASVQMLLLLAHWNDLHCSRTEDVRECLRRVSGTVNCKSWRILRRIALVSTSIYGGRCYVTLALDRALSDFTMRMTMLAALAPTVVITIISRVPPWGFVYMMIPSMGSLVLAAQLARIPDGTEFSTVMFLICVWGLPVKVFGYFRQRLSHRSVQKSDRKHPHREGSEILSYKATVVEIFDVGCYLWLYFVLYRDEGTTKPEWLEWLGM